VTDDETAGAYLALVIRLEPDQHGQWQISVDGTTVIPPRSLPPTTLIVRLWRTPEAELLRGTIRLGTDDSPWAPIQSNAQLEALVRAWLGDAGAEP
jgi:hypothetical protein